MKSERTQTPATKEKVTTAVKRDLVTSRSSIVITPGMKRAMVSKKTK